MVDLLYTFFDQLFFSFFFFAKLSSPLLYYISFCLLYFHLEIIWAGMALVEDVY